MSVLTTVTISAVALRVGGVVLRAAAQTLADIACQALSAGARAVYEALRARDLPSPEEARRRQKDLFRRARSMGLPEGEAGTVAALAAVGPLPLEDRVRQDLRGVPIGQWAGRLAAAHREVFVRGLTEALARACRSVGFDRVQVAEGRLIAEDSSGRALVAELDPKGRLKAEILGVGDASCHVVMDRFLQALATEGVTLGPEDRRFTGGVPRLSAGREWVLRRKRRATSPAARSGQTLAPAPAPKKAMNVIGGKS